MNVDKFGHHLNKKKIYDTNKWFTECALKISNDGNLNAQNKTIHNVKNPTDAADSATKEYVDQSLKDCFTSLKTVNQLIKELSSRITSLENSIKNEQNRYNKRNL